MTKQTQAERPAEIMVRAPTWLRVLYTFFTYFPTKSKRPLRVSRAFRNRAGGPADRMRGTN
jgi:hypothetical protein